MIETIFTLEDEPMTPDAPSTDAPEEGDTEEGGEGMPAGLLEDDEDTESAPEAILEDGEEKSDDDAE